MHVASWDGFQAVIRPAYVATSEEILPHMAGGSSHEIPGIVGVIADAPSRPHVSTYRASIDGTFVQGVLMHRSFGSAKLALLIYMVEYRSHFSGDCSASAWISIEKLPHALITPVSNIGLVLDIVEAKDECLDELHALPGLWRAPGIFLATIP